MSLPGSVSVQRSTGEHEHNTMPPREREQQQNFLTLLRPAMVRVDELGKMQTEMMRLQREMMGVVLSLTVRIDSMATTQRHSGNGDAPNPANIVPPSQATDNKRPGSDPTGRNKKTIENDAGNEHERQCHCKIGETLKESISRGVIEAKAEMLASISALSDRVDITSKGVAKLLKLKDDSSLSLALPHETLTSHPITTNNEPRTKTIPIAAEVDLISQPQQSSRKRRRIDFERDIDAVMDERNEDPLLLQASTKQSEATCKRSNILERMESLQMEVQELLERIRDPAAEPFELERDLAAPPSSTIETEAHSPSRTANTEARFAPALGVGGSSLSSANDIPHAAPANQPDTTITVDSDTERASNSENGSRVYNTAGPTTDRPILAPALFPNQQITTNTDIEQSRPAFLFGIAKLMFNRGTPLPPSLTGIQVSKYDHRKSSWAFIELSEKVGSFRLAGRDVDLLRLWMVVVENGGAKAITSSDAWARILPHFDLPERFPGSQTNDPSASVAFTLSKHYCSILYPYELLYQRAIQEQKNKNEMQLEH